MQIMIAIGMFRRGFLTSSPAVVMASKPMYEKNATDAPAVTPAMPWGANGERCPSSNAVKAIAQNATRMPIFSTAIAAVALALSLTPRTSRVAAIMTTTTAGRLITPPSPGPEESAAGRLQPTRLSSSSLTYWLQPTATAETETPYSRSRHQPTRNATRSPSVA